MTVANTQLTALESAIGAQLRKVRLAYGLSQKKLGVVSGFSAGHISLIENGRRAAQIHTIKILCKHLDVPVHKLIKDSESEING